MGVWAPAPGPWESEASSSSMADSETKLQNAVVPPSSQQARGHCPSPHSGAYARHQGCVHQRRQNARPAYLVPGYCLD